MIEPITNSDHSCASHAARKPVYLLAVWLAAAIGHWWLVRQVS